MAARSGCKGLFSEGAEVIKLRIRRLSNDTKQRCLKGRTMRMLKIAEALEAERAGKGRGRGGRTECPWMCRARAWRGPCNEAPVREARKSKGCIMSKGRWHARMIIRVQSDECKNDQ